MTLTVSTGAITAFKIISIAIASIIWAASCGHTLADLGPIMESNIAVIGLLYTGLVTTAAALWVQSYAFEEVREEESAEQ
jgi:type IV secretory pathway VirB6-like protein